MEGCRNRLVKHPLRWTLDRYEDWIDLENLTTEMGQEIQRLNVLSQHEYNPMSDEEFGVIYDSKLNHTNHIKLQLSEHKPFFIQMAMAMRWD